MDHSINDLFSYFSEEIVAYLPNLLAGLVLLGIGWALGWFAKRVWIQLCVIFRLDRFLQRFSWGAGFAKADVRYGLYSFIGNFFFFLVFVIFLNNALSVLRITILSKLLEMGIFFLPRIVASLSIFGIGWLLSLWVASSMQKALRREDIPRATLLARFTKTIVLLFFSAMALAELNIAREIVIIGFTTIIITLGILTIVLAARGGNILVSKIMETLEE